MKAALVLHGDPPAAADLALLAGCDLVVCADGGALALLDAGLAPDLVVGDMDGLGPAGVRRAAALGVALERHPEAKDATDGELALAAVLARGPREVLILGAHGGRSAMFLANLQLLRRCHALGLDARMVGRGEELRFAGPGQVLALRDRRGAGLDVLAFDGPARVTLRGTAWDARDLRLEPGAARGVSNAIRSDEATVEVHAGLALVVVAGPGPRGPPASHA